MTTKNDDFWGDQADWPEVPEGGRREPRASAGKTVSRWWNRAVSSGSTAHREHGGSRSSAPSPEDLDDEPLSVHHSGEHPVVYREPADTPAEPPAEDMRIAPAPLRRTRQLPPEPAGEVQQVHGDEAWDADWEITPAPTSRPSIDPLLARIGGAAIVLTLLVPVFLGFGSDGGDEPAAGADSTQPAITLVPAADTAAVAPAATTAAVVPVAAPTPTDTTSATSPTTVAATATTVPTSSTASAASAATMQADSALDAPAVASGTAERVEQRCAVDYTVVAGDFWIRLADATGIPLAQLLDVNDATSDTPLYPGSTICLPEGARAPAPPTTAPPATTAPAAPPTTARPTTTVAPTTPVTTARPPVTSYPTPSAAAVQQIIRDVWPDELEDRAIQIADRESNFVATAQNSCCYGIFQMHFTAHRSWLADLGVTTPQQLFDPQLNAYAAYVLYQRSGGWGPWT